MTGKPNLMPAMVDGWHAYQNIMIESLKPLNDAQLGLRAAPKLRSVDQITRHIIGARARWFYQLMGEGGDEFKDLGTWDRRGEPARSSESLVGGLIQTWDGMQAAISDWSADAWQQTWPGEYQGEPEIITRPWVIWHLIEHDLFHGGEISLTLGAHGIAGLSL